MVGSMIPQEAYIGGVPALREDLRLHKAAPHNDGTPCWTIQDPVTNQFYMIGWLEFELLSRWWLGKKEDILRKINLETPLNVSSDELDDFLEFLTKSKLIVNRGYEATAALIEEAQKKKLPLMRKLLHNYLFFRVPIFHPDRFLKATYPLISGLYSQSALWVLIISALAAFYFTVQQIDLFATTFVDTLTLEGIAGYMVALVVTKAFHELGHAYTATHYGTRVSHMGVAFVVMWPMLYTDTGETWRVTRSKHRLGIASAGVATELSIAVFALLAWNLTPDGALRNALFFLATTAWVISLLINVSPFLRFDGYYILSDILNIPNLHQRSADAAKTWMRKWFLGWDVEYPESTSRRKRNFYITFSVMAWFYRMIVFIGIAVAVYHFFFKALGIFLGIVEIWWFVLRPMVREFGVWREGWSATKFRNKLLMLVLMSGLIALLVVPWKSTVSVPAFLSSTVSSSLYATSSGVLKVLPANDKFVTEGELLFEVSDPDLDWSLEIVKSQKVAIEDQLKSLVGLINGESERIALLEQWKKLDAEERQVLSKMNNLKVIAPFSGVVRDLDPLLSTGSFVNDEVPLARIVAPGNQTVKAFVEQDDIALIEVGSTVKFYPITNTLSPLKGEVVSIDQQRTVSLPNVALSATFGGEVLVEGDKEGLTPTATLYGVKIKLEQLPKLDSTIIGSAVISTQSRSFLDRMFNAVASVFVREMSF